MAGPAHHTDPTRTYAQARDGVHFGMAKLQRIVDKVRYECAVPEVEKMHEQQPRRDCATVCARPLHHRLVRSQQENIILQIRIWSEAVRPMLTERRCL